ncbi:hypothetical protein F8M41_005368 [Gigaspora margarita]|uniref:Uncharacterized protein n=1 Tax=Gigaspora margarita TaxID=4874 RepID=A0A8H4A4Q4_GIGMA|nr:hypothetical protein F8M41_005368 [Gigaspora margarita]
MNNIPLGEKSTARSKHGWISAKMQKFLKIDARAERRTWSALCLVNQLLSKCLVTLESLVTAKASPNFFKTMNLSYYSTFYKRVKGDENAIYKIDLDDSELNELENENTENININENDKSENDESETSEDENYEDENEGKNNKSFVF